MLKQMKEALSVTEQIYDLIRKTAAVGMAEQELFSFIQERLIQFGYKQGEYKFDFLSGSRTSEIDGGPTLKKICKNDLLLVDFSLQHESVWCDTCRTFFFGVPSEEQTNVYKLLLYAMNAGYQMIGPNVTGDCVYRAVLNPIEQRNLKRNMPHHAGHGIGARFFQSPVLDYEKNETLKTGDFVTLEPGIYFPEQWGIRIENDFLVTEDGAELLFSYPLDLEYFILM